MEEKNAAAVQLGSIPKQRKYEQVCPVCHEPFKTTRRGVYCSANCRAKAHYQARRQPPSPAT